MTLSLYFARRFFTYFLRVLLIIGALMFLVDLLENISRGSQKENAISRAFILAGLNVPSLISQALALIIMLASISFSVSLARSNEFIISRAAGVPALKSLSTTGVVVVAIGLMSTAFFDPFAYKMSEERAAIKNKAKNQSVAITTTGIWLRQKSEGENLIIHAASASRNGKVMQNITVHKFNEDGVASERYFADVAFLNNLELVLFNAKKWDLSSENPDATLKDLSVARFKTSITPQEILSGFPTPETLPVWKLPAVAKQVAQSGFTDLQYRMQFQSALAKPLLFIAMFVIGTVFTLQNARLGNLGWAVLYALSFGFSLYFLQNFSMTLGEAGQSAVIISVWFPSIAAILCSIALFLHLEDG